MRYLDNREKFLKNTFKKIDRYSSLTDEVSMLNEEIENSGPMANDIPWGDSLLGKLINSTIRLAKVGANVGRIKLVVKSLKRTFKQLLKDIEVNSATKDTQEKVARTIITFYLTELQNAVDNGYKVKIIKNLTDSAITELEKIKKEFGELEGLDKIIGELKEFKKFLEQFDENEGADDPDLEEDKTEKDSESSEAGEKSPSTLYPIMIKNLKALAIITDAYKRVKIETAKSKEQSTQTTKRTYKTLPGDTVDKIVAKTDVNVKKLTADVIRQKNTEVLKAFPKNNQTLKPGLILVMENVEFINEAAFGTGGSPERGNIQQPGLNSKQQVVGEDHLTQAFTKLKKDIEILISSKEKGIGVDAKFLNEITSKSVDSNTKEQVKALYIEINRYLVGDKKEAIQAKEPLFKESVEVITDKNKRVVVAEKIARFSKRALQFDKQNLYGGLGDISRPLQDFVESLKQIMQMVVQPKKEESKKQEEVKKESKLLRYNSYLNVINEADDTTKSGTSQKIRDYFYKNVDFKGWVYDKTQVIQINKELENQVEENKKTGKYILSQDPIIQIVRLFNRAYKLHTTQVIPTGRSGGAVSNSVFREYTCFGDGSPSSAGLSGGPYRNNAIFNEWEKGVMDVLDDPEHQKIFRGNTVIMTKEGKEIPDAGKNLFKFMNELLDGEQLYKEAGRSGQALGRQREFLSKYFGVPEEEIKGTDKVTIPGDEKDIGDVSKNMPDSKDLSFSNVPMKFTKAEELAKTIFGLSVKKGDKEDIVYFFIQSVVGDIAYVAYCDTFYFFKKYITNSGIPLKNGINKGSLPGSLEEAKQDPKTGKDFIIKATTFKVSEFFGTDGSFKAKYNLEIPHINKYDGGQNNPSQQAKKSANPDEMNAKGCYFLAEKGKSESGQEETKRFVLNKKIEDVIRTNGGFTDVAASNDIRTCLIKRKS